MKNFAPKKGHFAPKKHHFAPQIPPKTRSRTTKLAKFPTL